MLVVGATLSLLLDGGFIVIAALYDTQVVEPMPMTYLSEITFPFDFCVKLAASTLLCVVHLLEWIASAWRGTLWHVDGQVAMAETLAWSLTALVLWSEHRRSLTPSRVLRSFWLLQWLLATGTLVVNQTLAELVVAAKKTPSTPMLLLVSFVYVLLAILGISCFFTPTPVSVDLIVLPAAVHTPSYYCRSARSIKAQGPGSTAIRVSYGSFGSREVFMKDLQPPNAQSVPINMNANAQPPPSISRSRSLSVNSTTRSLLIQRPVIRVTIPSSTTSMWGKQHFVSYKIDVQTDDDRWSVRRQYSDFALLHDELPSEVAACCKLPPDEKPTRRLFSWRRYRQPLQSKLERYLQLVLRQRSFEPYSSQALCDFLDMEYVDEMMLKSYNSDVPPSWDHDPLAY